MHGTPKPLRGSWCPCLSPLLAQCVLYHANGGEGAALLSVSRVKTLSPSWSSQLWPIHRPDTCFCPLLFPITAPLQPALPRVQACTPSGAHSRGSPPGTQSALKHRDNVQRMGPKSFHGKPTGFGSDHACLICNAAVGHLEPQIWAKSKPLPFRLF